MATILVAEPCFSMGQEYSTRYTQAIRQVLDHPYSKNNTKHTLVLEQEAYQKWLQYAKTVETMMGDETGYLTHITDWAGKLPGAIARIAALLHIMRHAHDRPWEHPITLADMAAAVKIGHCLINHALAIFDLLNEDEALPLARDILKWIKQYNLVEFTHRDCLRRFRRVKKAQLCPALGILKEKGYLEEKEIQPSAGRSSIVFTITPPTK